VVEAQVVVLAHGHKLNEQQEKALTEILGKAALKVRDTAYKQMAQSFREHVAAGLDMALDQLNQTQQAHLDNELRSVAIDPLKEFGRQKFKEVPVHESAVRFKR
jgi:hypothetical protein